MLGRSLQLALCLLGYRVSLLLLGPMILLHTPIRGPCSIVITARSSFLAGVGEQFDIIPGADAGPSSSEMEWRYLLYASKSYLSAL